MAADQRDLPTAVAHPEVGASEWANPDHSLTTAPERRRLHAALEPWQADEAAGSPAYVCANVVCILHSLCGPRRASVYCTTGSNEVHSGESGLGVWVSGCFGVSGKK